MHNILDNFFDNNSFFKTLTEKDKIKLRKSYFSYEKNIFLFIKILGFVVNALSIAKIIRKC